MRKILLLVTFLLIFFNLFVFSVNAQSSYVLPYPSSMPGSSFYRLHLLEELILKYWYYGDFGQFTYSLKESDKYLVEAKTLFEYKQYLLGYKALEKSNKYFLNTMPNLLSAREHGKDIKDKIVILSEASKKHQEELVILEKELPQNFVWSPEKAASQNLPISKLILESIKLREKYEKTNI